MKATQTSKLLDYLLSEGDKAISSSILSEYLNVSTRQIRKYIASINEDARVTLIKSSNRGYILDHDAYLTYRLHNEKSIETPETRQNYIIQRLVSEKSGYDIFDLSDELYVSIASIENDLKNIRQVISNYDLTLKREKNILTLIGNEVKKRNLMSHLISSDSYDNFVLQDEVRLLTFHYHFWGFRTTIHEIFAENDIFVNDYTLNNTALHLIIMIDRIRNKCILDEEINLEKLRATLQYKVCKQIQDYIESTYHLVINDAELYNLILIISNNTTMIDYSFITPDNMSEFIESKYIEITRNVMQRVEECYCLSPFDEDYITKFTIHVKNLFNRMKNKYYAKNPLTAKIKTTYPLIYDIAVFIAQEFKRDYQINLNEDEITFIAFHIGSYFENNVRSKTKVTCAFIYADYYSIHKKVLDRIMQLFGDSINMKYATSVNNYRTASVQADLIISTVDMPFARNYVTIHPFMTEKDIRNIREHIDRIFAKKRGVALKTYLTSFFHPTLFYKDFTFDDKLDAISLLSKDIIALNYADDSLCSDIIAREQMSSTAFHNVAVPHSLTKSAKKSFISIAINEKPMQWGEHSIQMIAMIGVNEDSRKIFSEVFDELIEILSEPMNVKVLIQSRTFHEFISNLMSMMS